MTYLRLFSSVRMIVFCKFRGITKTSHVDYIWMASIQLEASCVLRVEWWRMASLSTVNVCFLLLCVTSWRLSLEDGLKAFPHREHLCGFSPLWALSCCQEWEDTLKSLPHRWHMYGFSPMGTHSCCRRWDNFLKTFPHSRHWNVFSLLWVFWCFLRLDYWLKVIPHRRHSFIWFLSYMDSLVGSKLRDVTEVFPTKMTLMMFFYCRVCCVF